MRILTLCVMFTTATLAAALGQPFDEARAAWDLAELVTGPEQTELRERARSLFTTLGVMVAPPGSAP